MLDRSFHVVGEIQPPFPMRDVHGIACFDDRLWVTCSFDNLVAIYDLKTGQWSRWFPAPSPADRGRDVHHFNTVCKIGSEICLIAHHFGPSELLFYDCSTLQLNSAISIGVESHNVFMFDDAVATCSSLDGWLVNVNGKRLRTGNFPRGIAITSSGNLLGLSVISERNARSSQSGILRWYTSDWRFRADCVLPRVGMVLDILELAEREDDWHALENWPDAEFIAGEYNHVAPGNQYAPNSFLACVGKNALEWHGAEESFCWTAARRATLSILINPGENRLCIKVGSSFPLAYIVEIWLNETLLGVVRFSVPSIQKHDFHIPAGLTGPALLAFRTPHLWRPKDVIAGSSDERLIGVAVHSVAVEL
jgi:hypothetical protein